MGKGQPSCTAWGIRERCKLLPEANAVRVEKISKNDAKCCGWETFFTTNDLLISAQKVVRPSPLFSTCRSR